MHYQVNVGDKSYRLDLKRETGLDNGWVCKLNGREIALDAVQVAKNSLSIIIGGRSFQVRRENSRRENASGETGGDAQRIFVCGKPYDVVLQDAKSLKRATGAARGSAGPLKVRASMPGKVVRVLANRGDSIRAGSGILVIEAMKMQNEVRSPKDGTVRELLAREGVNVNAGDVLAVLE